MKFLFSSIKKAEHRLRCSALSLDYPELMQCLFQSATRFKPDPSTKSFPTGHRLNQAFAFPSEFSIPRVKRQSPRLAEPHIRGIIKRKIPRTRQCCDLRSIKINHAFKDQLFPCGQKLIHLIRRHPASPYLLDQHMAKFIPPENGRDPFGIHFQQTLNRALQLGISDKEIRYHRAIDNNHGKNLPSPLTSGKVANPVEDEIISAPHQSQAVFLPRSMSFADLSLIHPPERSSARRDFFYPPLGYHQLPHSVPRLPLGSRSVDSSSPAPSGPRANRRAHFVWSKSACRQTDITLTANQHHSS